MRNLEGTILGEIIARRRERLSEAKAHVGLERLRQSAEARSEFRDFAGAISGENTRVIAELKRASPTGGELCRNYRHREIARGYEAAEASALSVLTEEDYFLGSLQDLVEVRQAVRLPVLRKDFILDPYQIYESAAAGADALLLIVAALENKEFASFMDLCRRLRLAAVVEVHTEDELSRAAHAGARIIGVNNRNLKTMEVDLETSFRLRPKIPRGCIAVSESGIKTPGDLKRLSEARYHAALIGERFMRAPDPGKELAGFLKLEPALVRGKAKG